MHIVQTPLAPSAIGPYSQGIETQGFFFFSGQIPLTPEGDMNQGDIQTETKQVLANIKALLDSQGLSPKNVVKATVFLTDLGDFEAVNELYAKFFGDHKPARSCIQVSALPKKARIEIEIIAQNHG